MLFCSQPQQACSQQRRRAQVKRLARFFRHQLCRYSFLLCFCAQVRDGDLYSQLRRNDLDSLPLYGFKVSP